MSDCLFCKIASGAIPAEKLVDNEKIAAFRDINPKAPVHILVIPKKHIARVENLKEEDRALAGEMILTAQRLAQQEGLKEGFRLVFNNGPAGGQEVEHLHLHLLGGRQMKWPPG